MFNEVFWGRGGVAAGIALTAALFLPAARFAPEAHVLGGHSSTRTITVVGTALAPTVGTSQDQLFINVSATGSGPVSSAMVELQAEANAVSKVLEHDGVSSSAISQNNLGLYWNPPTFHGKVPSSLNAHETLTVTVTNRDSQKTLAATVSALSKLPQGKGIVKVSLNAIGPTGSSGASAQALDEAMAAATKTAAAIARRMGVSLGAIQSVRQEPSSVNNGCACAGGNQNALSLTVVFSTYGG